MRNDRAITQDNIEGRVQSAEMRMIAPLDNIFRDAYA